MPERRLSVAARALLFHVLDTRNVRVDNFNRPLYRELARAGVMYPVSGFVGGPEATYRFTDEGWERRMEWLAG